MKGLLSYSGITAKLRAMEGKLITDEEYKNMAASENVPEAVSFLQKFPAYKEVFSDLEDNELHRGTIERLLTDSLYHDYTKLYRFAGLKQRPFLKFYFQHFEIDILKTCLRNAAAHQPAALGLIHFQDFFNRHSEIDLVKLSTSADLDEFISNLEGSIYYRLFTQLKNAGDQDPVDYEMALDLFYFNRSWSFIKKKLPKSEQRWILESFGRKLDLLNLQWIYRTKKYYSMDSSAISSLLIPLHYKLKKRQLERLTQAEGPEDFFAELSNTWYGSRISKSELCEQPDLEALYCRVLNQIHHTASKQNPYSMAALNSYFYFKERELKKIITIIESIRYRVDIGEILAYIDQN